MTTRGKLLLALLVVIVAGLGAYTWWDKLKPGTATFLPPIVTGAPNAAAVAIQDLSKALIDPDASAPTLDPGAAYVPKDNIIDVELSQYAGYSGFVAANGGLEPNENSVFFKKYGFKVRLRLSEDESWPALNAGRMAASATTTDVLAVYGRTFDVIVPSLIGYSRGADGVVVRKDVRRINDLKGRTVVTSQFTEADFFLRYLAQQAGLSVAILPKASLGHPAPDKVNVVYASDAFAAGDLFLKDIQSGANLLAGCVTWAPKTTEVANASNGAASLLVTSKNLLIISDIFIVNKGFAAAHPEIVKGLVAGMLEGNRQVRDNQAANLDVVAKAFKWTPEQAKDELSKVHLANLPENLAYFSGAIDAAGSFDGIYQSAVLAYGADLLKDSPDPDRFADLKALKAIDASGEFAGQQIAIAPIRSTQKSVTETDPILSKDIHFLFEPNSPILDASEATNATNIVAIKHLLQVSPGSTLVLRGHTDTSRKRDLEKLGDQDQLRSTALSAMQLSKERANSIRDALVDQFKADPARLQTVGRGWEEPTGGPDEEDRRVEVLWFTAE